MNPTEPSAWQQFQAGGWIMYPLFILGVPAVMAAVRFAWKGEHQLLGYLQHAMLSLAATGVFGFCICVMRTLWYVAEKTVESDRGYVLMVGLRESLNTLSAASMFIALGLTLTSVGKRRFPLPNPSSVPR